MREEGRPELTNLAVLLSGHHDTDHRLSIFNDVWCWNTSELQQACSVCSLDYVRMLLTTRWIPGPNGSRGR